MFFDILGIMVCKKNLWLKINPEDEFSADVVIDFLPGFLRLFLNKPVCYDWDVNLDFTELIDLAQRNMVER